MKEKLVLFFAMARVMHCLSKSLCMHNMEGWVTTGQATSGWGVQLMSVPLFCFNVLLKYLWSLTRDFALSNILQPSRHPGGVCEIAMTEITLLACSKNLIACLRVFWRNYPKLLPVAPMFISIPCTKSSHCFSCIIPSLTVCTNVLKYKSFKILPFLIVNIQLLFLIQSNTGSIIENLKIYEYERRKNSFFEIINETWVLLVICTRNIFWISFFIYKFNLI